MSRNPQAGRNSNDRVTVNGGGTTVAAEPARDIFARLPPAPLWVMILGGPILFYRLARDPFTLPKLLAHEWLGLASVVLLAATGTLRPSELVRSPAAKAIGPLVVALALGTILSPSPHLAREAAWHAAIGLVCLVAWSQALTQRTIARLLAAMLWPASGLAIVALLQATLGWQPLPLLDVQHDRMQIAATLGNPADLGAYLALAAVCAATLRTASSARRHAGWWWASLTLVATAMVATQTVTALLALAAGLAVLLTRRGLRPGWSRWGIIAGIATLAITISPLGTRLHEKLGQVAAGDFDAALTGRLRGFAAAAWMLQQHPLAGVGPGAFKAHFVEARRSLEAGLPVATDRRHRPVFAHPHQELLAVGAELGVCGLLAIGWFGWVVIRRLARAGTASSAALPALVTVAVLSLGHFPFRLAVTAYPALLLLAGVLAADPARPAAAATRRDDPGLFLPLILALAMIAAATRHGVRELRANVALGQAEQSLRAWSRGDVETIPYSQQVGSLQAALDLAGEDGRLRLALGNTYLVAGQPARALPELARALELEPRPETYLAYGRALLASGQREPGLDAVALAARLDPGLRREAKLELRRAGQRAREEDLR